MEILWNEEFGASGQCLEWLVVRVSKKQKAAACAAFYYQTFYFYFSELGLINCNDFSTSDLVGVVEVRAISRGPRVLTEFEGGRDSHGLTAVPFRSIAAMHRRVGARR